MVLAAATFLPFGGASAQTVDAAQRIADAANRFLAGLDEAQRKQAMIAFDSGNRLDWHYIPRSRQGLTLGEMKPAQRDAAHALFASVLNERGLQAIENVRIVEGVLREQQGSFRDPDRYFVSIFGTPGHFPWGWRLEGHHLSLNVALPAAGHISATPFFIGSHPATVRDGPHKGLRPLGRRRGSGAAAHGLAHAKSSDAPRSSPSARSARSSPAPAASATSASRPASRCRRWTARRAISSRR